ncbi:MAG TPA: S41 family peptidase [Allosphingosinicella sp.]|nr:S41 family peptidase [Allosphingosinicella sp.]
MKAIEHVRAHHIDSAKADWSRITADALAEIGGAQTPRDTYGAIRGVLGALGEKHSFLLPAPAVRQGASSARAAAPPASPPKPRLPTWKLMNGRYGVIRLPALNTFGPGGPAAAEAYADAARSAMNSLDAQPLCGWIVDLRGNTGGNMWPMLQGVDPLLGPAPFGYFVSVSNKVQAWQRQKGRVLAAQAAPDQSRPSYMLKHTAAPLAILLDGKTASSGEMVAIAFAGRPGVRSFGQRSAGYATANGGFPLSDGATLILTTAFVRDRAGTDYLDSLRPDVEAKPEEAEREAARWLSSRCREPQASSSMSQ